MSLTGILHTFWVTSISMLLIVGLERRAFRIRGTPLSTWQRWLIPLLLILMLAANLDSILSLQAWLEPHPGKGHIRYLEKKTSDDARFLVPGLIGAGLLPFAMGQKLNQLVRIAPLFFIGYFAWFLFVWIWLAFRIGLPVAN